MNFARALCFVGSHDLTGWRNPGASTKVADGRVLTILQPYLERHCKRKGCTYTETRAQKKRTPYARKLKAATDADTIQPGAPHG